MGFFGKPKPGPAPRPASTAPTASPASTALRTPTSVAASSPVVGASSSQRQPPSSPVKASARASSPLKLSSSHRASDDELTPPPSVARKTPTSEKMELDDDGDTVVDGDESPVVSVCSPHGGTSSVNRAKARCDEQKERWSMSSLNRKQNRMLLKSLLRRKQAGNQGRA